MSIARVQIDYIHKVWIRRLHKSSFYAIVSPDVIIKGSIWSKNEEKSISMMFIAIKSSYMIKGVEDILVTQERVL